MRKPGKNQPPSRPFFARVLTTAALTATAALVPLTGVASASEDAFTAADPAAWQGQCAKGDVCVWSGSNGTGTRCAWTGSDPDWQGGSVQCRPHGFRVNSIWNNGYAGNLDMVQFYSGAGYSGPLYDPVTITTGPINAANVAIRSHKWV